MTPKRALKRAKRIQKEEAKGYPPPLTPSQGTPEILYILAER